MGVTTTARAAFTVDGSETIDSYEHGGAAIGAARLTKTFVGDIAGTSRVDMLGTTAADGESRAYVAIEAFDVTLDGKVGTFVLVHYGIQGGPGDGAMWTIAPGSGSGELEGISGTAQMDLAEDGSHELLLEYTLGPEV